LEIDKCYGRPELHRMRNYGPRSYIEDWVKRQVMRVFRCMISTGVVLWLGYEVQ